MRSWRLVFLVLTCLAPFAAWSHADEPAPKKVTFRKTQLDAVFRSEGVAVADFNKDGKLDIAAGYVVYYAPDWKPQPVLPEAPEYNPKGYSNSFCTYADDLNRDGWPDLIVIDFPGTPTWWFVNPQDKRQPWTRHTLTPVTNNESPTYLDINGDERRELVAGYSPDPKMADGPERRMAFFTRREAPSEPWDIHPISQPGAPGAKKYDHGLGVGDVNGDGRLDMLCDQGWWEAPEAPSPGEWKFHAVPFGRAAHMHVYDFDGDGDSDVLTSSPHAYGIWWHEQSPGGKWQTHEIDKTFSQTHSVCLADINGDGLPDFVTGKRWWAHAAGDPGVDEPAVIYWFELTRENGRAKWTAHQFDHDSGVGTQFEVVDVNGDGLLDVVTSNKKGVFYFEQSRS
jgi:hypothetical protein